MGRGLPSEQNVNRVIAQKLLLQGEFYGESKTNS